ncbi:MAG TPA: hypothetical protein V6C81_15660 [Planktothrix sp.]
MFNRSTRITLFFTAAAACALAIAPAWADSKLVQQGIDEYTRGDYDNASGHLGEALSTDFNNPKLHYFLGSSYVHLNQRDGAIREFRIAYALQPQGEVGDMAKKGLALLGVKPTGAGAADDSAKTPIPPVPAAPINPVKDKALSSLRQQTESLKASRTNDSQSAADSYLKHGADDVSRQRDALNDLNKYYSRRGGVYQVPLTPEQQKQLDALKSVYDGQRNKMIQSGSQQATEIQKSSENLQNLLDDKGKPGDAQLVPAGTNLYIRNYQSVTPQKPKPPTK